jgi:hypothetical protein
VTAATREVLSHPKNTKPKNLRRFISAAASIAAMASLAMAPIKSFNFAAIL